MTNSTATAAPTAEVMPRYVSVADVAKYASVSKSTVRNRIQDGRLKAYRFGGRLLLDLAEVDEVIRSGGA